MVNSDDIAFNVAAFVGGLFVLEFGADKFTDHTAKVAARTRIPPTLIALFTAGAEWEELAVVVAAISQHQSPLALGNIVGSSISNILGAFSLGLIFSPKDKPLTFDSSAKIYTGVLLGLTTFFSIFMLFFESLGHFGGALLVATFIIYIISIGWAIYRGIVAPPEDSDSDSDSDLDLDSDNDAVPLKHYNRPHHARSRSSSSTTLQDLESGNSKDRDKPELEADTDSMHIAKSRLSNDFDEISFTSPNIVSGIPRHSTLYHSVHLFFGLLALSLSGYILSHSIATLSDSLNLSSTILGVTLLSFATTLPEKLVSIFSGSRGESDIVIANTAGSNIFLVTLCAGVLFLTGDLESVAKGEGGVTLFEVAAMWGSSVLLFMIVMLGGKRWMGWGLMALYVVFIAGEFLVKRT